MIVVKLFAVVRDRVGAAEVTVDLPAGVTAGDVIDAVAERHPDAAAMVRRSAVAVNREYVPRSTVIADGDEVAIIPPVSGGAGPRPSPSPTAAGER